jgi:hypothetical protein
METVILNSLLVIFYSGVVFLTIALLVLTVQRKGKPSKSGNKKEVPYRNPPEAKIISEEQTGEDVDLEYHANAQTSHHNPAPELQSGIIEPGTTGSSKKEPQTQSPILNEKFEGRRADSVRAKDPLSGKEPKDSNTSREKQEVATDHPYVQMKSIMPEPPEAKDPPSLDADSSSVGPVNAQSTTPVTPANKKEIELSTEIKQSLPIGKANPEQTQVKQEKEKAKNQEPREPKAKADDLTELFAKNIVEENEANRLADGMDDIKVEDLLQEGKELISKLRKRKG